MIYSNKSILIIDDDSWMQKLLSKIFNKMEINKVYLANNGFDGINLAIEKKPDVIFLDLIMPIIDGILTLKLLKSLDRTKHIPIVIITTNSDVNTLGTVLSSGAKEFVAKPFTYTTVMEKLEKIFSNLGDKVGDFNQKKEDDKIIGIGIDDDDFDFFKDFDLTSPKLEVTVETRPTKEKEDLTKKYRKDRFGTEYEIKKIIGGRNS